MISYLHGPIVECNFDTSTLTVAAGGVGYDVAVLDSAIDRMKADTSHFPLFVHAVYREDSAALYGFLDANERDLFRLLLAHVDGVGAKSAMTIMGKTGHDRLVNFVATGNVAGLAKFVSAKMASNIVNGLKGRVVDPGATIADPVEAKQSAHRSDAVAALGKLGVKRDGAFRRVDAAISTLGPGASLDSIVMRALKNK